MTIKSVLEVTISAFIFFAYIMLMSQIIIDLFRDQTLSGAKKGIWIIALVLFPFITAFIYILARGEGMGHRYRQRVEQRREAANAYIREVAGPSSVEQIARAKMLLDEGVINNDEFIALKRGALSHAGT